MEHEQATDLLSEYLEGDLAADQAAALEQHLESCRECSQTLAMLSQALRAVNRMPKARAPAHFARRVKLRARRAGLLRPRRQRLMERMTAPFSSTLTTWGLLLAVGLLLVVVMIAQQQIELLMVGPQTPTVDLDHPDQLAAVEALVARLDLAVEPRADPGDPLELAIPEESWPAFIQGMRSAGLADRLPSAPKIRDGIIRLRIRLRPDERPRPPPADHSSIEDRR